MSQYNWANLSDHDFELVCRDVMKVMLQDRPVEAFARGRDGGIDLRYEHGRTFALGQAKHYLRTPYSKLLSDARIEKGKVDGFKKKPSRYILFTSLPLTPGNKEDLKDALKPYCKRSADILGIADIEGFIQSNPEIEKHHYKLWLSSVRVLEKILGNATRTHSELRINDLTRRARLFVQHDELPTAEKILKEERNLIISGQAGIGKTTLAEMLSLRFLSADYSVNFVARVSDLEREWRDNEKQLFIYDDFLGRTNLSEAPLQSDQERLFTFMRHIRTVPNKYLIMTTREYLYREARAANERMVQNRADVLKCMLDVTGYSKTTRAQILYNHLYWASGFTSDDLRKFVTEKGYRKIISHPEFNPRFIADTINRISPHPPTQLDEDADLWT